MGLSASRCRVELKERVFKSIVQFHDGSLVATAIAVVWRTEDGDNVSVMTPVVALHDKLVGTGHKGKTVGMIEGFRDVLPKGVAGTPGGDAPAPTVIWV